VEIVKLRGEDRAFVFDLIDRIQAYQDKVGAAAEAEGEEDDE
jgi:ribosome assembly protein YihI (activator of Der GTPase)